MKKEEESAELAALKAENERYRKALKEVIGLARGWGSSDALALSYVASRALATPEGEKK